MENYNLSFYDALKECIENGKAIRGEHFGQGAYIALNKLAMLTIYFLDNRNTPTPFIFTKHLTQNIKYRVVNELTEKELSA